MKKNIFLALLLIAEILQLAATPVQASYDPFSPLNVPLDLVQRDASGNFSANAITATLIGNASNASTAATAISFTGSLNGDITGTQSATVVSLVGGETASEIASTVDTVTAATNANTPSTLVLRDGSGNFVAGTITAAITGAASNNLLLTGGTESGLVTFNGGITAQAVGAGAETEAFGLGAGNATSKADNTFLGFHAGNLLNGAGTNENTGIGSGSLAFSTANAVEDTAVGYRSMYNASAGAFNTCVGNECGFNINANDQYNSILGYHAGMKIGGSSGAIGNSMLGSFTFANTTLTTGSYNLALGFRAGDDTTATTGHTAFFGNLSAGAFTLDTVKWPSANADGPVWLQPIQFNAHVNLGGTGASAVVSPNAGTGGSCAVTNPTGDHGGHLQLVTTAVSPAAGTECTIAYAAAFTNYSNCTVTETTANGALQLVALGIAFPSTASGFLITFSNADVTGHTYDWSFHCFGN